VDANSSLKNEDGSINAAKCAAFVAAARKS